MLPSGLDANSRSYAQQYAQQPGSAFTIGAHGSCLASWLRAGTEWHSRRMHATHVHTGNLAGALQAGGMQASQLGVRWDFACCWCLQAFGKRAARAAWGFLALVERSAAAAHRGGLAGLQGAAGTQQVVQGRFPPQALQTNLQQVRAHNRVHGMHDRAQHARKSGLTRCCTACIRSLGIFRRGSTKATRACPPTAWPRQQRQQQPACAASAPSA